MWHIMSTSIVIVETCVSIVPMLNIAPRSQRLVGVPKLITLVDEPYSICHSVPRIIEVLGLILFHVPVKIFLSLFISNALFDNFSAMAIKHALVSHFLEASSSVFVHLVTLGYFFPIRTDGTLCVCLESLLNRSAIFAQSG